MKHKTWLTMGILFLFGCTLLSQPSTPSSTPTPTHLVLQTPTATASPTHTPQPTSTPTPTPWVPQTQGTPLPSTVPITRETVSNLHPLAIWEKGFPVRVFWTPDYLFIVTLRGLWAFTPIPPFQEVFNVPWPDRLLDVDITPDGHRMLTIHSSGVYVWDLPQGTFQKISLPPESHPSRGVLLPDGQNLIVDLQPGELTRITLPSETYTPLDPPFTVFTQDKSYFVSLFRSDDGRYVGGILPDYPLQVWELPEGKRILFGATPLHSEKECPSCILNHYDVKIIDQPFSIVSSTFYINYGAFLNQFDAHGYAFVRLKTPNDPLYDEREDSFLSLRYDGPYSVAISNRRDDNDEKRIVACGLWSGKILLYRLQLEEQSPFMQLQGHTSAITNMAFSPDNNYLASIAGDGTLRIWDLQTQTTIYQTYFGMAYQSISLASETPRMVLGGTDSQVLVKNASTGLTEQTLPITVNTVRPITIEAVIDPQGQQILGASFMGRTAYVWNLENAFRTQYKFGEWLTNFALSSDGKLVALSFGLKWTNIKPPYYVSHQQGYTRLFKAKDLQLLWSSQRPSKTLAVAFSPDGQWLASGDEDGGVSLYPVTEPISVAQWNVNAPVYKLAFSPDGQWIAVCTLEGDVAFLSLAKEGKVSPIELQSASCQDLAYSPDGTLLAIASNRQISLMTAPEGRLLIHLKGQLEDITGLAFSANGNYLYSSSQDGTIYVWGIPPKGQP